MDDVTVQDLISLSYEQKPIDFQNAFNALMSDKITSVIDDKKIEVAQSMFGGQEEEDTETELEDQDQEEQTDGETT
jgi:hypothetical protein